MILGVRVGWKSQFCLTLDPRAPALSALLSLSITVPSSGYSGKPRWMGDGDSQRVNGGGRRVSRAGVHGTHCSSSEELGTPVLPSHCQALETCRQENGVLRSKFPVQCSLIFDS